MVVGDEREVVGIGYGKANEVPLAIQKGVERAKKDLFRVPKHGSTITHQTTGMFGAGRVLLKPASPGTGVIAGGGVRAVLELAGIHDILSKSLGTQNPINLVKATVAGLRGLRTPEEVAKLRGLSINQVLGLGGDAANGAAEPAEGAEAQIATSGQDAEALILRRDRRLRGLAAVASPRRPPPRRASPPRGDTGLMSTLTVTQRRSRNGANRNSSTHCARSVCAASAIPSRSRTREQARGMLHAVRHLVEVSEEGK